MQVKPYPEAKRRILIERSEADFIVFLEEVTDNEGKLFIRNQLLQRKVPGFRDGRAPLKRTVPLFIAQLKSEQELTNCDSPIWDSLTNTWMYWVKSHPELDNILTTFDNKADFDDNHQCIMPPNSKLDTECFKFLLEVSCNTPIHQEMIRRFYEYGYFNEDERIEDLINQVPPCEEIEQRERLAVLSDKVDELSQAINKLSQTVSKFDLRISDLESDNKLERKITQLKKEIHQTFEAQFQKIDQRIQEVCASLDAQSSKIESNSSQITGSSKLVNGLETRLSGLEKSVKSLETKPAVTKLTNNMKQKIAQLVKQQIPDKIKQIVPQTSDKIKSFEERFVAIEKVIAEIKSKTSAGSRIAAEASKIGKRHGARLRNQDARYSDEEDYLSVFRHGLRRFGVTDSEEEARAIHVAMKAFPALEIADAQIIRVWNMVCGDHLHCTSIDVEMGWFGLQDWFPDLFSQACFKERLEQADLELSIKKMIKLGDMPWMIYLRNCDRSFPEIYLPHFLDWIGGLCGGIKIFLIRSSWVNRCETNEDFYARVARLPEPQSQEPIEVQNLKPRDVLTLTEWESWCLPDPKIVFQYETYLDFLEELRSTVGSRGWQIPIELLREIQHYLRLSHNIMAKTCAFDWALTLRLLPWIGNRRRLIDVVENIVNKSNQELSHFQAGLQVAREVEE